MQQQLTLTAMKQFSSSAKTGFRFFCYDIFIEKYKKKMRIKIGFSGFSVKKAAITPSLLMIPEQFN